MTTSSDAARVLADIERTARQLEAVKASAVARIRRDDLHKCDGHIRLSGWLRTVVNMPSAEANRLERLAALVTAHPQVGHRLGDGTLGVAQAHRLAVAHANRRVAWSFPSFVDLLVDNAMRLPFDDFSQVIDHWQRLADADGAHRHAELVHDGRDATIHTIGDTTFVDAHIGTLHGTLVTEVFEHFLRRELDRDIAERDAHGSRPGADLPRTPAQRRADALVAVFTAAAGRLPSGIEPLVNIVIDAATFEAALDAIATGDPLPPLAGTPATLRHRRCHSTAGHPIDPIDAATAAITGHARRVVIDSTSTVIDLGRRTRLFTGAAREAVFLRRRRCIWPGCHTTMCEADHRVAWVDGGTTSPDNGDPLCRRHNKLKATGYTSTLHPDTGTTTITRPDGRPLVPL